MKFICSSTSLYKNLMTVGEVINSSNTVPIIDNFLFELSENTLKVTGTDLESTMQTVIEVETDSSGKICVPARMLTDSLKDFPEQPLTFIFHTEENKLEIVSENGKYALAIIDANEYPELPEMGESRETSMSSESLALALRNTTFATGNDDLRPTMSGVFFQLGQEHATFVATDAHKMVRYRRLDVHSEELAEFIMAKKPLALLTKGLLPHAEDEVKVIYNDKNACFTSGKSMLLCRLIDGKYPNYEAVIPQENPNTLFINRQNLLDSLRRVSRFASKSANQVKLTIQGNEVIITSEDIDFSSRAEERLRCDYNGEDMEIGFNARYVIELLTHLDSENISMLLSNPNRAGIILPGESADDQEDLLMLVMPIMISE